LFAGFYYNPRWLFGISEPSTVVEWEKKGPGKHRNSYHFFVATGFTWFRGFQVDGN